MQLKVFDFLKGSSNYWSQHNFKVVSSLEEADILCLNGGSDIATEIYGEEPITNHKGWSYSPKEKSWRDEQEIEQYNKAKALGKFVFGICRGAQLVTCLEGGSLWQHVNMHYSTHPIKDLYTGLIYSATSVHHQMMRPSKNVPHQIIAYADESNYKISQHDEWKYSKNLTGMDHFDPEIVWYPEVRALCVQGHPEYAVSGNFAKYCTELIQHLWSDPVWPPQKESLTSAG